MAWLGSTVKALDTRREVANYIGGATEPSKAVVTNSGGEIDSSVVTVAELAHLSGITSNVQTQLDSKQATVTGAATTVTSSNLTSNRVLLSNGDGKISASDMTATTFAYLDPTSSIQDQLGGKQDNITTDAPLSQSKVSGLTSALSGKQSTIGSTTNLVVNKVTFGSGESAIPFQGSYSDLASRPDLSSYATSTELSNGLAGKQDSGSYATSTELSNGLAGKQDSGSYATSTELSNGLAGKQDSGSYATSTELSNGLAGKQDSGDYATSTELSNGLAGKQDSGDYATSTELSNGLAGKQDSGDYATSTELSNGLAGKQDSGDYATSTELSNGLAGKQDSGDYATSTELSNGLAGKQDSGSYATSTELSNGLAGKQDSGSYATSTELSNGLAGKQDSGDYATTTQLAAKAGQGDPMTCVTAQVTGNAPINTTGTLNIDNANQTKVTFAGSFTTNGINHPSNSSIFNVNVAAEYTINVQIRVTNGGVNERGMYWVVCRRYKQRPNNSATGNQYRDYYLGSSYYRDDSDAFDDIVLGGNARIHFEGNDEQFEIVVQRAYTQQPNSGNNPINNSESFITIERHAYEIS